MEEFRAVEKFASKLKQYETAKVKSVLPEILVPRGFVELGFDIEFEPSILGTRKNPDFKAFRTGVEIFVEITNLVEEENERTNRVKGALWRRLRRVPERFVFGLRVPEDLEMSEIPQVVSFVRATLRGIGSGLSPGSKYYFSRVKGKQVVLTVDIASPRTYGYLGRCLARGHPNCNQATLRARFPKRPSNYRRTPCRS